VNGRQLAAWAELFQLHAVWVVTTVLLGDVVALFAIYAGHGDLWPNVGALAGHDDSPQNLRNPRSPGGLPVNSVNMLLEREKATWRGSFPKNPA